MRIRIGMLLFLPLIAALVWISCAQHKPTQFPLEQMRMPPGKLSAEQVPLFVSFGTDDNPYSGIEASGGEGGMHYLTEMFATRKNPAGNGNPHTFDGQTPHYSFYVNTKYITSEGEEDPTFVKQSWKEAFDRGNEVGVHTHSHPHGEKFKEKEWEHEIRQCLDLLTQKEGLDIPRDRIIGFRTPFLEYGDPTFTAVQKTGFIYDCSIEEGFQDDADGRNFVWPYVLDHGSPGNEATYKLLDLPLVQKHPGLWELPVYAFIVPPDELCDKYGVTPGFRARMKQKNAYFELDQGKITGMDWNLWFEYGMDKAEFLATLKYTLDLRLQGNRAPLTVGVHSAIYADRSPENPPKTTVQERRDVLREFVDYALSKPEVRLVSAKELLGWIQSPAPLLAKESYDNSSTTDAAAVAAGATLPPRRRLSLFCFRPEDDPGPAYWARVGREMVGPLSGLYSRSNLDHWPKERQRDRISFPVGRCGRSIDHGPSIKQDPNEAALDLFDQLGFRIWLQVEPRFASTEKLLRLMLQRYSHHPCIVGIGIDVEWNKSTDPDGGEPVSDAEAREWLAIARSFNPKYRLFLKHWLPEKMPPTVRDGLLFVDDSQILPSLQAMIDEFAEWGKAFAPAPVAYQIGYPSDRPWWIQLKDPPKEIGSRNPGKSAKYRSLVLGKLLGIGSISSQSQRC